MATLAGMVLLAAAPAPANAAVPALAHTTALNTGRTTASAQAPGLTPMVHTAVKHDTSPPLRTMKPALRPASAKIKTIPLHNPPHKAVNSSAQKTTADVQKAKSVVTDTMPGFQQNFDGVGNVNGVLPPDTQGAVGPNNYVQMVNLSLAIYDKQGNLKYGPVPNTTLWQGFGGPCETFNGGDPVTIYDESANRWFMSQLAYPGGSAGYHECIAVSQTGDPTGAWYRYDFLFSSNTLNDYPKFGVWPDAYYMSANDFLNGQTFTGVTAVAFNRAQMLAGQQASDVSFTIGSQYSSLLPSNAEGGALGSNPPAGAPDPYLMSCDAANGGPCSSDQLDEWDFHVDWSNPASSTFGTNGAPSKTFPVAQFNSNLCNYNRNCIPQPGTSQGLDTLSDRLMYQSAYRNLGSTQALVVNQTVNVSPNPPSTTQAGVRWYELTNTGSGWSLNQQGTYAPDSDNRWMASANIDAAGDIALGYSTSSSTTFPSIRVAGRLAGDPAGLLAQGETTMMAGAGSQTNPQARWGDYSAMQVDPTDGCTFWYTSEYLPATSDAGWRTRIGSFKFPSCTAGPHGDISGTVTSASTGQPIPGATVASSTGTTTTDGQGHYDLTVPVGSYNLTAQAYGYQHRTVNGVQVTQGQTTTENFKLSTAPSHILSGAITDGSGHGYGLYAKITIGGYPGGPIYTNPYTGQYSVSLAQGNTYSLTVTPVYPGYNTATAPVSIGSADKTLNLKVTVDQSSCIAPGYAYKYTGSTEGFTGWTGTTPQDGWSVVDNAGNGETWQFGSNPTGEGAPPNTDGQFAIADSNHYPAADSQDTSLVSPVVNLSSQTSPEIGLDTFYREFPNQTADVDISLDGGKTWSNVWEQTTTSVQGHVDIPIPQAAGQSTVQVRFHFKSHFGWWWSMDNVFIGNRKCAATPGGLVDGIVTDNNTGNPVNGAKVASQANPGQVGISAATADPSLSGAFYWLFATPAGATQFTASDGNYTPSTQTVNVAANAIIHQDWSLRAGHLSITPGSLSVSQTLGAAKTKNVKLSNDGTEPVQVKLSEQNGGFTPLTGQGSGKGAPLQHIKGTFTPDALVKGGGPPDSPKAKSGAKAAHGIQLRQPTPYSPPWTSIANYPSPIMDNAVAYDSSSGKVYSVAGFNGSANVASGNVYDPSSQQWSPIADAPQALEAPAGAFLNGKMYLIGGWDSSGNAASTVYAYDPSSNSWSQAASLPTALSATSAAVLNGQLYVVGGCTTGNCAPTSNAVYRYDPGSNAWTQLASYPTAVAFTACAGIASEIVCAGGTDADTGASLKSTYIYNPGSNTWSQGADMLYDDWAAAYSGSGGMLQIAGGVTNNNSAVTNQASQYDPSSNSWSALPNANNADYRGAGSCGMYKIGGSTGGFAPTPFAEVLPGFDSCGTEHVPWLSESTDSFTLTPGQSQTVAVTMDSSTVSQPGAYTAKLAISTNSPYEFAPIGIAMQVNPPATWGEIVGTVNDASGHPITGATVQICTMYDPQTGTCGPVTYTLKTDILGDYRLWLNHGFSPLQIIAAKDGYQPVAKIATITKGTTTTVNFALNKTP
jgi:N-acetylneuraminic acid mutarotase